MKHINLQMFADDEPETSAEAVEETPAEEESPQKTYTDEEVDKIIERKMAEWQKKQEKERRKQDEAQKLKDMNDQQKAEYELKQLREELATLKQKDAQSEMLKTARGILADKNISVSDALVGMLISEDADKTNDAVNEFAELFRAEVDKAVKDALKGKAPRKGESSGGITKEQIMQVKNRAERQKLINEHLDLFK